MFVSRVHATDMLTSEPTQTTPLLYRGREFVIKAVRRSSSAGWLAALPPEVLAALLRNRRRRHWPLRSGCTCPPDFDASVARVFVKWGKPR
jgi:hypothetical protein